MAQVQGYGESIKRIMNGKRTSPPGSVSGGTSASDLHSKQPSPPRSVSRQVKAAKLAKTMTNKLLRSLPGNDQGSGSSQPSNDIPKHISIKKGQMLPFGSVMKPFKGAKRAKAAANQLKLPRGKGQVAANDAGVITPPKGSASKSTIDNPHRSAATSKSTTSNDPRKLRRLRRKATSNKQLKPPPGNDKVSAYDAGVIIPPKGSAPKSTIDNPHGSAASSKSTTKNRHEFASIEAKGAKARSKMTPELQQPPMTTITDP